MDSDVGIDMLVGYAIGGPRNGVKLSAPPNWDGKVRSKLPPNEAVKAGPLVTFHPGYYVWHPGNNDKWTWRWKAKQVPRYGR